MPFSSTLSFLRDFLSGRDLRYFQMKMRSFMEGGIALSWDVGFSNFRLGFLGFLVISLGFLGFLVFSLGIWDWDLPFINLGFWDLATKSWDLG